MEFVKLYMPLFGIVVRIVYHTTPGGHTYTRKIQQDINVQEILIIALHYSFEITEACPTKEKSLGN